MRATEVILPGIGEPESLEVRTRELPPPGAGQALVRLEASGISFALRYAESGGVTGKVILVPVPS
jgi:NADPH:quinone reductase-like Zn-dependent oxidoreductase